MYNSLFPILKNVPSNTINNSSVSLDGAKGICILPYVNQQDEFIAHVIEYTLLRKIRNEESLSATMPIDVLLREIRETSLILVGFDTHSIEQDPRIDSPVGLTVLRVRYTTRKFSAPFSKYEREDAAMGVIYGPEHELVSVAIDSKPQDFQENLYYNCDKRIFIEPPFSE